MARIHLVLVLCVAAAAAALMASPGAAAGEGAAATAKELRRGFSATHDQCYLQFQPVLVNPIGTFALGFLRVNATMLDLAVLHLPSPVGLPALARKPRPTDALVRACLPLLRWRPRSHRPRGQQGALVRHHLLCLSGQPRHPPQHIQPPNHEHQCWCGVAELRQPVERFWPEIHLSVG